MIDESPVLPCGDGARVDKGAEAPNLCLSPVEMHTLTAAGGLLPAGTASTAMMTSFPGYIFLKASVKSREKYQPDKLQPA